MTILEIKNLSTHFFGEAGVVRAVDGVSLAINKGEIVALVGGSGSGKTVLALSILGLVPESGRIVGGEILFGGVDLAKLSQRQLRDVRGKKIAMIFQEPLTALNPVFTVGSQLAEVIREHDKDVSKKDAYQKTEELLNLVGIPDPTQKIACYPHQLSGGQRQRAMIAMALSSKPDLLIADEPTTALDVTIQAQILDLLLDLQNSMGMSILFITHDLGVVAQVADRVSVMHNGKIVEAGRVADIFARPIDQYTKKLLNAVK